MGYFQCDVCMKQFAYKQAFDRHILTHDLEKILYSASMNPTNMNNTELDHSTKKVTPSLKATLPQISQDTDRHPCDQCEKSYKRKDHLTRHKLYHIGIRAFVCDVCSKTFIRKDKLQRHERTHQGNTCTNIICSVCHKMFNRKDSLKKHMKMHAEVSTVNKSTSTYCDQQEQLMSNMANDVNKSDFNPTVGQTNRFIQQIIQQEYGHEQTPVENKSGEGVIQKQELAKPSQAEMEKNYHGASQMSAPSHSSVDKARYQQSNTQLPMSSQGEMGKICQQGNSQLGMEKIHQEASSHFSMLSHGGMGKIYQQGNSQVSILSQGGMLKIHQQGNSQVSLPSHGGMDTIHQQGNSQVPMSENNIQLDRKPNPVIFSNTV